MLGPPVCLPCKVVYRHLDEEEWLDGKRRAMVLLGMEVDDD